MAQEVPPVMMLAGNTHFSGTHLCARLAPPPSSAHSTKREKTHIHILSLRSRGERDVTVLPQSLHRKKVDVMVNIKRKHAKLKCQDYNQKQTIPKPKPKH